MQLKPSTTAHLRVYRKDFSKMSIEGEISAGDFSWKFIWRFCNSELFIEPPLGRALIKDALLRFLIKTDYSLEPGGDYIFTIKAKF